MTTRMRRVRALCLVSALLTVEAGCDDSKRIRLGSTEKQVIAILGRPPEVYTEHREIERYLWLPEDRKNCVPKVVRVLYYRRRIPPSVAVGIDANDRVACVESYGEVIQ